MSGFTSGILAAADDPTDTVVTDNIANALAELRAGDRLYTDLVRSSRRKRCPTRSLPFPRCCMLPGRGRAFTLSLAYVEAARSPNSGIALRPGLQVSSITSDPLWNVDPSDQAIVPATELLNFSVVVGNAATWPVSPSPRANSDRRVCPVVLSELVPVLEPAE